MTTVRMLYRLFKLAVFAYGVWSAWKRSRWWATTGALWAILTRSIRQDARQRAQLIFVSASEPAIYERQGWRKLSVRRTPG